MIIKLNPFTYKKLAKISPSQFYSTLQCPYKMVLAEAHGHKPLIALSPNAYFGSILHNLIELITKNVITDDATFDKLWTEKIQRKDDELTEAGLTNLVPIKSHIRDIGLKKEQIRNHINRKKESIVVTANRDARYISEMPLFDENKTVFGKADLVFEDRDYAAIYDFKTGSLIKQSLNEDGAIVSSIKDEYEYQLKLYAHLYFIRKTKYPDKLYLVSLDKRRVEIPFTKEECFDVYNKAIETLKSINKELDAKNFMVLANCSASHCCYCMYRPACSNYKNWMEVSFLLTNDVPGVLTSFKSFANGNACAYLRTATHDIIVSGFNSKDEEVFKPFIDKKIILYNIKKDKNSINIIATKFTTIYEF